MFREVALHSKDKDFHRYLVRNSKGQIEDWHMCRVTFGVTSSPFLASATLRRVAHDHAAEHFISPLVSRCFYVNDFLHGSNTVEEALLIREDINNLLSKAQMRLRKWWTNSPDLLSTIPMDLWETEPLQIGSDSNDCLKALGVHWNTSTKLLFIATPPSISTNSPTKRQVTSQTAKLFDVLGWYVPVTVKAKHLLQLLWKAQISWDQPISSEYYEMWKCWNSELPVIAKHPIPRRLVETQNSVLEVQLHRFTNTSKVAYGAVIYARHLHKNTSISVSLLTTKTRVAPVKELSVLRLELCSARLLAKLISITAAEIDVPPERLFAWCDSTAVLGWLRSQPSKGAVFVKIRIKQTTELLSASKWRYVATHENPADIASRGAFPAELLDKELWWKGPAWLTQSPSHWPLRKDFGDLPIEDPNPPSPVQVLIVQPDSEPDKITRFSSFYKLARFWAYARRLLPRVRDKTKMQLPLGISEI